VAIVPAALLHFVGREKVFIGGWIHFSGVALGAGVATASAIALTVAGARLRDGHAVVVGCAFSVMAALLCLHGLATPGIVVEMNGVVAFTGGATLPVGGAILALGAVPALRRPAAIRPLLGLLAAGVVFIFALGLAAMAEPGLVPPVPKPRSLAVWAVLLGGMVFYAVLFWRALRTFRLTRRRADLLVGIGIVWLASALPAALLLGYWNLGWWLGHAFEIVGIAAVGVPVALDLRRGTARSRPLLGDLTGADLVAEEEAFLGSHVRALLVSLAEKDAYTEEHTRRVALRAVQVGDELGFTPERLRGLAVGGLLHDIGKLSVPDEILKKPGPLTESEFEIVKCHVDTGVACYASSAGFPGSSIVSCEATTSGSTARAIRAPPVPRKFRSTYGSSRSATCTTRSCLPASTVPPGHTSARWRCCETAQERSSTRAASRRSIGARPRAGRGARPRRLTSIHQLCYDVLGVFADAAEECRLALAEPVQPDEEEARHRRGAAVLHGKALLVSVDALDPRVVWAEPVRPQHCADARFAQVDLRDRRDGYVFLLRFRIRALEPDRPHVFVDPALERLDERVAGGEAIGELGAETYRLTLDALDPAEQDGAPRR